VTGTAHGSRRPVVAVIGNGEARGDLVQLAEELGRRLVDRGYRIVTGGLGGVMEAASRGARSSLGWREGAVVGILPGGDAAAANAWVDLVVPTEMSFARNVLVVRTADVVVAVGGGAGTLMEMAMAWQLGKPIVALRVAGWSGELAGRAIDERPRGPIVAADDAAAAVACVSEALASRGGTP
jgi:hypothetical protein